MHKYFVAAFSNGIVIALTLILLAQVAVSRMMSVNEQSMTSPSLESLPTKIGSWTASGNGELEASVREYLKPDNYILRDYISDTNSAPMGAFIAYFKSLQSSYGPHSPRVCLPGTGWLVRSSAIVNLRMPDWHGDFPVNQFELERDGKKILVMYWYQNKRNVWAEEFRAKLYLLPDLLRYRQFDVSLIRIITPLEAYPSSQRAVEVTTEFAQALFPSLVERFASIEAVANH